MSESSWLEPQLPPSAADLSARGTTRLLARARREILLRTYTGAFAYPVLTLLIARVTGSLAEHPSAVTLVTVALAAIVLVRVALRRVALADVSRRTRAGDIYLLLGVISSGLFASTVGFAYVERHADASITAAFVVVTGIAATVTMIASTHRRLATVWVAALVVPGIAAFAIEASASSKILLTGYLFYAVILRSMITKNYGAFWDSQVTNTRLDEQAQELARLSRMAGMNEIATNVLHDVGNALNSIESSTSCLELAQDHHPRRDVEQLAALLETHADDLAAFVASDDRGHQLVSFVQALAKATAEHARTTGIELARVRSHLEHVEVIVQRQQDIARGTEAPQPCRVAELVEHAVGLSSIGSAAVELDCTVDERLHVMVDRHRTLQILVNLLENAREATVARAGRGRVRVRASADASDTALVEVQDDGCGIPPELAHRIFARGFTTKQHGHGFGLHGSYALAQAMGGRLSFTSDGIGRGATFTLRLPACRPSSRTSG